MSLSLPIAGTDHHPLRGVLVPLDCTTTIAGIHRGIVNLRARDPSGEYLVSVISDPLHWTELAILVGPGHRWWGQDRSAGDRVALSDLDSRPAPVPQGAREQPPIATAIVQEAQNALLHNFSHTGFVALLSPTMPRNDPFVRRAAGLLRAAPDRTVSSISNLIGLGIGFTPAGDDFVSGVLLGAQILSGKAPTATARAAVHARLHTTTAGGSSLLRVATAGFPPAYQLHLVETLRTGDVTAAIEGARRHGHSSGLDALSGLLWRLRPPQTAAPTN